MVVVDVVDAVRQYTFICVEIKSVSETFISWSFTSVVFHNTDTFYLPSPFPLTLCVLINKKGVDTMTFRLTGKSPRQNLKTKLLSKWLLVVLLISNAGEARRRKCVCFPGSASIKALLCIDARCTRQYDVFIVDGPSISLGDQARVMKVSWTECRFSSIRVTSLFELILNRSKFPSVHIVRNRS